RLGEAAAIEARAVAEAGPGGAEGAALGAVRVEVALVDRAHRERDALGPQVAERDEDAVVAEDGHEVAAGGAGPLAAGAVEVVVVAVVGHAAAAGEHPAADRRADRPLPEHVVGEWFVGGRASALALTGALAARRVPAHGVDVERAGALVLGGLGLAGVAEVAA